MNGNSLHATVRRLLLLFCVLTGKAPVDELLLAVSIYQFLMHVPIASPAIEAELAAMGGEHYFRAI